MHLLDFGRLLLLRRDRDVVAQPTTDEEPCRSCRLRVNEWKRVGNNLNQIARRLNTREEPAPPQLEPALIEIRDLLDREHGHDR